MEEFASYGEIPTINALTDEEHPCQILADILTFQEKRGPIQGRVVAFIGDGACNVVNSWIFAAPKLDFFAADCGAERISPPAELLARAGGRVEWTEDIRAAAAGADVLYTDVGINGEGGGIGRAAAAVAGVSIERGAGGPGAAGGTGDALPPAYRGKEIDEATFEANAQTIFDEAENRLHAQKAVLNWLAS